MKVISREVELFGEPSTTYTFDSGHVFRQYYSGVYFAYTPKGNYAKQPTAHKLIRMVSEFEDGRQQVPA